MVSAPRGFFAMLRMTTLMWREKAMASSKVPAIVSSRMSQHLAKHNLQIRTYFTRYNSVSDVILSAVPLRVVLVVVTG